MPPQLPTSPWTWEQWAALVSTPVVCLVGIILTALTLPGNWVILGFAGLLKLWQPDMISWWTLLALVILAGLGEGLEFLASALGAAKAGGSKQGAIGAMLGSFLGALLGIIVPPPIVGSIVCACLGAAAGAIVGERLMLKRSWEESRKVATGAAIGRLLALIAKLLIAAAMAVTLCFAVIR